VEDFLTEDEVNSLRESCAQLVRDMDPNDHRGVFSTTEHNQVPRHHLNYYTENGEKVFKNYCRFNLGQVVSN
jgi:hypothetical protein